MASKMASRATGHRLGRRESAAAQARLADGPLASTVYRGDVPVILHVLSTIFPANSVSCHVSRHANDSLAGSDPSAFPVTASVSILCYSASSCLTRILLVRDPRNLSDTIPPILASMTRKWWMTSTTASDTSRLPRLLPGTRKAHNFRLILHTLTISSLVHVLRVGSPHKLTVNRLADHPIQCQQRILHILILQRPLQPGLIERRGSERLVNDDRVADQGSGVSGYKWDLDQ